MTRQERDEWGLLRQLAIRIGHVGASGREDDRHCLVTGRQR
jgi:hypothetical protein